MRLQRLRMPSLDKQAFSSCRRFSEYIANLTQACTSEKKFAWQECGGGTCAWQVSDDDPLTQQGFPPDPLWTESSWKDDSSTSLRLFQASPSYDFLQNQTF